MVIRKIPVYSLAAKKARVLTDAGLYETNFVITLPVLRDLIGREQALLSAEGALVIRLICRTLDLASADGEMQSLRRENCFDENEKNEWILDIAFTTATREGVRETFSLRLPLSLPAVADKPLSLWFNGTWLRLLLDGEVLNENSGVGDLCRPTRIEGRADIWIAPVTGYTVAYRTEETDEPADLYFPHGFNTNVGDAMTFYKDGTYHIVYLFDRRHHGSRGCRGAHYMAHLTTKDLITWEEQEPLAELEHPYETFGTGTMFYHKGKYYMSYGLHTSRHPSGRFIEPSRTEDKRSFTHKRFSEVIEEGGMPLGATLSVSEDGIHFHRTGLLYHGSQNPSVYATKDGGLILYGGYGGEGVYRTDDIATPFVRAETDMVFSGPGTALNCTSECPAFFEMNGYQYLIVGFRGYFRTLAPGDGQMVDAIKLGENIYDGLCVPMVAELENGRRIIAGWIRSDLGWGAALVQRELIAEEGGRLGMRWLPELYPKKKGLPHMPEEDGGFALTPKCSYLLEAEVEADENGIAALDLLGEGNAATQLRIDTRRGKAQLSPSTGDGSLTAEIDTPYEQRLHNEGLDCQKINYADCYAIPDVFPGRRFSLRILLRYAKKMHTTVCDIEIGGRRTMILSRPNFFLRGMRPVCGSLACATLSEIER